MTRDEALLKVENLTTCFHTDSGIIRAINRVSFEVKKGETVAVVGESGSGKSVTSLSIMGLIEPPGQISEGRILLEQEDLLSKTEKEMRHIRGNEIAMIFQEPLTSLNPVFTIGNQLSESLRLHKKMTKKQAREKAIEMLKEVGIARAEHVINMFPHSLSGGMRQRVMIAMALSCEPKLLIADEPTTALDVTIQAQILQLMRQLTEDRQTAIVLITHDLGVVAEMADTVIVMYAGEVVEKTDVFTLFEKPRHPYTKGLLESTPKIDQLQETLTSIKGTVPSPKQLPQGCHFQPRCPYAQPECVTDKPSLKDIAEGHSVRCWLHKNEEVVLS